MRRVAVVVAMCTAMLVTTAEAQTTVLPAKKAGSTSGRTPGGNDPGSAARDRATTSAPNLSGTIPQTERPPVVQEHKPIVVAPAPTPPAPARASPPDGGGTSECNCYRMEREMTRNRDGSITERWTQRLDGKKSLGCCPRR